MVVRTIGSCGILLVAALQIGAAQTPLQRPAPGVVTTSFGPWAFGGMLGSSQIEAAFEHVSIGHADQSGGTMQLDAFVRSQVDLFARAALPPGSYSIRLTFSHVNQPAKMQFLRHGVVLGVCSVPPGYAQVCDSPVVTITDGALDVLVQFTSGSQLELQQIAISSSPMMPTRVR